MNNSFVKFIDSLTSVLILLPKNPYFDQVAAGLSLYLSLRDKKDIFVSCPSPMLVEFNRLVGVDKVASEAGNKNLVFKFIDYDPEQIERVNYDVVGSEFRLSVIPKPRLQAPQKEQIAIAYSGLSTDAIILIGGANESHFPYLSTEEAKGAKIAHIGVSELRFSDNREHMSFAKTSSSISEIIYEYLKEMGVELDEDISTNLLSGIYEGSRAFASKYVGASTFAAAADLSRAGGKIIQAQQFASPTNPSFEKKPMVSSSQQTTPRSWLEPKIYKGTSVT